MLHAIGQGALKVVRRSDVVRKVCRAIQGRPGRPSFYWNVRHFDRQGRLLFRDAGPNMMHDEGEEYMVKTAFTEELTVPTSFYIGLDDRDGDAHSAPAEADTLADLAGEPSGDGYARQGVASDGTDWTSQQDGTSGDWEALSKEVTFAASGGDWPVVSTLFLATSSDGTGRLLVTKALSSDRTILDGESLKCTLTVRIGEAA